MDKIFKIRKELKEKQPWHGREQGTSGSQASRLPEMQSQIRGSTGNKTFSASSNSCLA